MTLKDCKGLYSAIYDSLESYMAIQHYEGVCMTIHNYSRVYYSHFLFSELLKHLCLPGKLND